MKNKNRYSGRAAKVSNRSLRVKHGNFLGLGTGRLPDPLCGPVTTRHTFAAVLTITLFLSMSLLSSCSKDFIEDDLGGRIVTILAPADNDTVASSTPLFWWEEIDDARTYRIQVAWPSFASPQQLLYDTAVAGDRFFPSLQAGYTYQWRIRPENGSSSGDYVTRMLTIDSSAGLSSQLIIFSAPSSNPFYTNNTNVSFAWNTISGATFYRIDVTDSSNGSAVVNTTSVSPAFNYVFAPGLYRIQVRAENSTSFTAYTSRVFTVDNAAPVASAPQSPANNATGQSTTVNFTWIAQSSDRLGDSLLVSTDSTFATTALALYTTAQSYSGFNAGSLTNYYWKLKTRDLAGNWSGYSTLFKFTTQ
ncbi:MAG: hypothetical protein FD123_482 [Bacteroidetes bacterium]|nr:MAG: hypothetical protein FD123_482 [Bacteroidota bacterium]